MPSRPASPPISALLQAATSAELAELDRLLVDVPTPPANLRAFVQDRAPRLEWTLLAQAVEAVLAGILAGRLRRVIILAPVRHGKSELVSRIGAAYYLRRRPTAWVGLCCHTAELANLLSANARTYYGREALSRESYGKKHWETGQGGGMWAAGVGGPITGKGFDLGIIDDPVKNAKDAASATVRRAQADWYDSTFVTRQQTSQAAIILITTRWHADDLIGHVLAQEAAEPEHWHIVDLPALAEREATVYPPSCTRAVDPRRPGAALWPSRWPVAELERRRHRYGDYWFGALYQNRPTIREGGLFRRAQFTVVDSVPVEGQTLRYWDTAATAGGGDFTAGVKLRLHPNGQVSGLDVVRGQWSPSERDRLIRHTAEQDGVDCRQRREQEPGASGKDAALAFVRMLRGYSAAALPATGSKEVRAEALASEVGTRGMRLLRGAWNAAFVEECCAFPTGRHDDQVDAASGAYNALARRHAPAVAIDADDLAQENPFAF